MIKYAIVKRRNPMDASVKYYAARTDSKLVPTSQLVSRMVESCTVTEADASAVISAYVSAILRHLKNGRSCKTASTAPTPTSPSACMRLPQLLPGATTRSPDGAGPGGFLTHMPAPGRALQGRPGACLQAGRRTK